MQEWKYNTINILSLDNHVGVAQPHVVSGLTYVKISLCPKNRSLSGPHARSPRCAVTDFCPCREYNCDSEVNKTYCYNLVCKLT